MIFNLRSLLCRIFCLLSILFITATTFAQQEQQSDSTLSHSQFIQIIDRINKSEENLRSHADKKFGELDKKIDDLDTKFHELDKKVAVLRSDVDKLFTIIIAIAVAVGAHLLIFIGSHIYTYWRNKTDVLPKVVSNNQLEQDTILRQAYYKDKTQSDSHR